MLVIKDINRYRDGGSIGIDVIYSKGYNDTFELEQTLGPDIVIDFAIGSPTPGAWYNGFRGKGGKLIEDAKFKALVIKALEQRIKHDKYALDQMR